MAKKTAKYLLVFSMIFLVIFFLGYFFLYSAFSILGPAKQFPKEKINLQLYGNERVNINNVLVKVYYCQPQDRSGFAVENWRETLTKTMAEVSEFYRLQFDYNMKMDFKIYSEVVSLNHSTDYFTGLVIQDLKNELAEPHSESQSLKILSSEIGNKMKNSEEWELGGKKTDGSYVMNLFVLELDINALQADGVKILGLNNESDSSLVFSTGFIDDEFKDFYGSVVGHEIGHGLGIPKFYSYSDDSVKSSGIIGGGLTRKLKNNYLTHQIKEKMME